MHPPIHLSAFIFGSPSLDGVATRETLFFCAVTHEVQRHNVVSSRRHPNTVHHRSSLTPSSTPGLLLLWPVFSPFPHFFMGLSISNTAADSLEPQVQVLREFLSEYEHEASGGGHSTGGTLGGSRGGGGMGLGDSRGDGSDADDRGMDEDNVAGGGMGGGGGGNSGESSSRGRDWVRHELCGKLVSNLFSSKTLRERLSKKPVAGILVGLLCGPPIRWNNGGTNSAGSGSVSVHTCWDRLIPSFVHRIIHVPEIPSASVKMPAALPSLSSNGLLIRHNIHNTPVGCSLFCGSLVICSGRYTTNSVNLWGVLLNTRVYSAYGTHPPPPVPPPQSLLALFHPTTPNKKRTTPRQRRPPGPTSPAGTTTRNQASASPLPRPKSEATPTNTTQGGAASRRGSLRRRGHLCPRAAESPGRCSTAAGTRPRR